MSNIQLFNVAPSMPPELEFLETLSYNLWWSWNPDAIELFRRIDPKIWKETEHSPFAFLSQVPQKRLEGLVEDDGYMSHLQQVRERFDSEVLHDRDGQLFQPAKDSVGYFSLEYGIHESVRLYSGGLGCLAGDHLKSASDLNVPLVGAGLMYRCGYFQQYLNSDGWQREGTQENEIHRMPVKRAHDASGHELEIAMPLPDGVLKAIVWRVDVGRVPLFLLDANIPENPPEFRKITSQLYEADRHIRLRQELLLGFGGFQALLNMGFDPPICHMNEGHAAFVACARISHLVKDRGMNVEMAKEQVRRTNVFTTHTPVPAGNETFSTDLVKPHLMALEKHLGFETGQVISWGQSSGRGLHEITMTTLALRMSEFSNGVSRLHGLVTRKMWADLWPNRPEDEIPIGHITNGVHVSSWLSPDNVTLFDRYLGPEWRDKPSDEDVMSRILNIPDEELWRAHGSGRSRLIRVARELGEKQLKMRNAMRTEISQIKSVLHHDALTIGFARRFASYKRATLLLRDPDRLIAMLSNKDRPVQIVLAGKAHPADDVGKELIRQIIQFAHKAGLRQKVVFLENYDIRIARYLVQGVDLWLNTPRRPQEASGTSGMKAAANGAMHVSILDGWWDEGYSSECGWAIGHGEEYDNLDFQDAAESLALYNLFENEIIPMFYDRTDGDVSRKWVAMMKASMKMAMTKFSSHRMVSEYEETMYQPARQVATKLAADNRKKTADLVDQRKRLESLWDRVRIESVSADRDIDLLHVGDKFIVHSRLHLGELLPAEVAVEVYYGPVNTANQIISSHSEKMELVEQTDDKACAYRKELVCRGTGRYGFSVRVVPSGTDWEKLMPGFMTWPNGS